MAIQTLFALLLGLAPAVGDPVELPKPQTSGGKPLMQALSERKSAREFSARKLPPQILSNLLWAGYGVNRSDGRRTAPSANNRQTIGIYVATPDGAFLYDAGANRLETVAAEDLRALTGTQPFVKDAAVNLVYVADMKKWGNSPEETKLLFSGFEAGSVSQNVYLYCASEGLATVVRAGVDRAALGKALKLSPDQRIILAQSVGYPK
jgi:nitroreductase